MTAFQLNLFPGEQPIPVDLLNRKRKSTQRPQASVIEQSCTTARAASLLQVSTTTLYRAKKSGKAYRCGPWTAEAIGENAWKVLHDRL